MTGQRKGPGGKRTPEPRTTTVNEHDNPGPRSGSSYDDAGQPVTAVDHLRYAQNRAYRSKIHIALMTLAARDIDPTHLHYVCQADGSCCAIERLHMTHIRIFNQLQRDGIDVTLVHADGTPCEHNLEEAAVAP